MLCLNVVSIFVPASAAASGRAVVPGQDDVDRVAHAPVVVMLSSVPSLPDPLLDLAPNLLLLLIHPLLALLEPAMTCMAQLIHTDCNHECDLSSSED